MKLSGTLVKLVMALLAVGLGWSQPTTASGPTTGNVKVAVVLVNFTDTQIDATKSKYVGYMSTGNQSVRRFFEENSYNQLHITGRFGASFATTDVYGPYPASRSFPCDKSEWTGPTGIAEAAKSAIPVPADYNKYVITFDVPPSAACGWASFGAFDGANAYVATDKFVKYASHELGHTLGLGNSTTLACGNQSIHWPLSDPTCHFLPTGTEPTNYFEYEPWDSMGRGWEYFKQYNIYEKKVLGWVSDAKIKTVTASGTYTIHRLQDLAPGADFQGLKIPIGSDNYWVEYRQPVDGTMDNQSTLCQKTWGSAVHLETGGGIYLIDTVPGPGDPYPDCRSLLTNGESFSDPTNPTRHVTIKQATSNAETATYEVTFDCARADPTLIIPYGVVPKGGSKTFQLQVKNNDDGPGCGPSVFSFSGKNFAEGILSFDPSSLSLQAGLTGTVLMTVSAPSACQDPRVEIEVLMQDTQDPTRKERIPELIPLECAEENFKGDSKPPAGEDKLLPVGSCPAPALSIAVSPDAQVIAPGGTLTFTAFVTNALLGDATISLTPSVPSGWNKSVSPNQLSLRQGESGVATLQITVPSTAPLDTYRVSLTAKNLVSPFQYSVATADIGVDDDGVVVPVPPPPGLPGLTVTPDALSGNAGVQVTYTLSVKNNGASLSTFNIDANSPTLTTSIFPSSRVLAPGESAPSTLTVTVPTGLGNGSYSVTVSATDITNTTLTSSAQATYTVRNCRVAPPEITLSSPYVQGPAGSLQQLYLTVMNWDPSDCPSTTFRLASTVPGAGWTSTLDPVTLNLSPHSSKNAVVTVTSPISAGSSSYIFTVSATDMGDPSHSGSAPASYVIPPPVANKGSVKNGNWSDPTVWSGGTVPTASDVVDLRHFVIVDSTNAHSSNIYFLGGHLAFSRTANSMLTVHNGEIYVNDTTGWLDLGTDVSPIPAGITARLRMDSNVRLRRLVVGSLGARFTARGATKSVWVSGIESAAQLATFIRAKLPNQGDNGFGISLRNDRLVPNKWRPTVESGPIVIPDDPPPDDGGGGPGCALPTGWATGDLIAIDAEQRLLTSVTCETSDTFRITFFPALGSAHPAPPRIANLTRNVVIEAAGANQAHIRNESYDEYDPRFEADFAEFYQLGGPSDGPAIQFVGANGILRNSVVRASSIGLGLAGAAHAAFENNVIFGNGMGIRVSSSTSDSLFASNYLVANGTGYWAYATNSENTYLSNTFAFNSTGLMLTGSNANNLFVSNQFNNNSDKGFQIDTEWAGWYLDNFTYANGTDVYQYGGAMHYRGGGIGYDRTGAARPATVREFGVDHGKLMLNLYGVKAGPINLSRDTPYFGLNQYGEDWFYVLSYNQNGEPGTLRGSGAYVLKFDMVLDYAVPLKSAFVTNPNLVLGRGHYAYVNSVVQSAAQSQLISIRRVRGTATWTVEGSKSGVLGTFTGSISNQGFPSAAPQFYLTFTPGPIPADKDLVNFVLFGSSGDAGVQKKLIFEPVTGGFRPGNKSIFTVIDGASLTLKGVAGAPATMGCDPVNCVNYTFRSLGEYSGSGGITFNQVEVRNLDAPGLQVSGIGGVSLSSTLFDNIGNDGGIPAYMTLTNLTGTKQFSNITFANTAGVSGLKNVNVTGTDSGLNWYFASFSGAVGGPTFEVDPNKRVNWKGYGPVAPTNVLLTTCTSNGFTVKWTDNSTDETKFHLYDAVHECGSWVNGNLVIGPCPPVVVISQVPSGVGSQVTGNWPTTGARGTWQFKVRAVNAFGDESTAVMSPACFLP